MLSKDLGEICDDLEKKTRKCDALNVKVFQLEKGLVTLHDALKENEKRYRGLNREWFCMPGLSLICRRL